jgi:hypothetical protein
VKPVLRSKPVLPLQPVQCMLPPTHLCPLLLKSEARRLNSKSKSVLPGKLLLPLLLPTSSVPDCCLNPVAAEALCTAMLPTDGSDGLRLAGICRGWVREHGA